jgi:hypothetical protein
MFTGAGASSWLISATMVIQQSLQALTHHTHCRQLHKICMSSFNKSTTVSSFQSWLVIPWVARLHLHTSSKWQQCQPSLSCRNRYTTSTFTSKGNCYAHDKSVFVLALGHDRQGILYRCILCHACWPCSHTDLSCMSIVSASRFAIVCLCSRASALNEHVSDWMLSVLQMGRATGSCCDPGPPTQACSELCRFGYWTLTLGRSPSTRMLQVM